jgi:hypothetical protein
MLWYPSPLLYHRICPSHHHPRTLPLPPTRRVAKARAVQPQYVLSLPFFIHRAVLTRVQSNLEQWLQYREEFSDEFMRHEAFYLGAEPSPCQTCGATNAPFRCLNCFSSGLSCKVCITHEHAHDPLHKIQVSHFCLLFAVPYYSFSQKWNGLYFDDTSLFELGVSYQLGHDVVDPCPFPSDPKPLTLFDISGVHQVRIRYCYCRDNGVQPAFRRCQLLRARWFPATWSRPKTAFTFRLLDFLHKLQTQSKINLYDFHASLTNVTNAAGQTRTVVRFFPSSISTTDVST